MNDYLHVIILAIIQGITELLPISSSAHLTFIPWLLGWPEHSLALDAALHLGTAIAVGGYFAKQLVILAFKKSPLLLYVVLANIPAVIIGVVGEKIIESYLHQSSYAPAILAGGLIIFGVLMWYVDKVAQDTRKAKDITLKDAMTIGFAQAVALIPGVSRSGITITSARFLKLNRADAAYFSFLLGMPVTFGAGLYKTIGLITGDTAGQESFPVILTGIIVSATVGWLVIKWLLRYVQHHSLSIFMWYRVIIGFIILIAFFL